MRKLFSLMLVVLGAAALVSCSKDDDDVLREGEGVITFVTKAKSIESNDDSYLYLETFNTREKITVDWGDGWGEEEYVSVKEEDEDEEIEVWYEIHAEHTYTDGKSSHTVTVRGKIKSFYVDDCEVTSMDVTKCPALEELSCENNELTSLDISKNTALEYLDCKDNQFSASAMNKIYNDLPQGRFNNEDGRSYLSCDRLGDYSIAENKGWYVSFEH